MGAEGKSRPEVAHKRLEVWETGFSGIRTFAGCPHVATTEGVDVAIVGVPFDGAASFRPGARFGPEAIRAASGTLRGYHPSLAVDVFEDLSIVDRGDVPELTTDAARTSDDVAGALMPLVAAEIVPIVLGGDHSITFGELKAVTAAYGPAAIVLIDAHADTLQEEEEGEPFSHGTWLRRAVEQGLVIPERSTLAGMRGSVLDSAELEWPRELGFDLITCDELRRLKPSKFARRIEERAGDVAVHLSVDIDVVDPAFAPGTGTPEVGGLASHELLALLRATAELDFASFDVVEVSPPYDNVGQTTALLAANVVHDFMALVALSEG